MAFVSAPLLRTRRASRDTQCARHTRAFPVALFGLFDKKTDGRRVAEQPAADVTLKFAQPPAAAEQPASAEQPSDGALKVGQLPAEADLPPADEPPVEVSVPLVKGTKDERDVQQDGVAQAAATLAAAGSIKAAGAKHAELRVLPALYDAWFAPQHQLAGAVMGAVSRAHAAGIRQMEVQWPCVPNLEEIEAGTRLNQTFGFQVAAELALGSRQCYPLVKRYLASYANLYWAKCIASIDAFAEAQVYAVRGDSVRTDTADLGPNLQVAPLRRPPALQDGDVAVVIDPRYDDAWYAGARMRKDAPDATVIFMNSEFNETYGLTGPRKRAMKDTKVVYMLKRVTRGYVFYSYPGPWIAYLEKPDCTVEVIGEFEEEPKLGKVARLVREESNRRYGGMNNDRYVRGMGGRL